MADLKVLDFKKKPAEPDYVPHLPTEEDLEVLLQGKPVSKVILITVNEDGLLSHYLDNVTTYEAVGLLEDIKWGLIAQSRFEGAFDIDD